MGHTLTRREFLLGSGVAAAGALAACTSQPPPQVLEPEGGSRRHVLRIAHLTDIHMLPIGPAADGMRRALQHAQGLEPRPDVVFNTGDSIMDALTTAKDLALAQWETFHRVLNESCSLPIRHLIGNHDVWGWGLDDPEIQSDPLYGKGMALEQLGLSERYYSFSQAGWHYIALDSNHLPILSDTDIPYTGQLDDEQFAWLEKELADLPAETPVCLLSHIPILCACEFFDGPNEDSGNWVVPGAWMHIDARRLRTLFLMHPNVRLCLSGHAHQHDRVDYLGVKYVCSGAVSGNWWMGSYLDFPPAYVVVDLFDDGSSEHTFVPYDQV